MAEAFSRAGEALGAGHFVFGGKFVITIVGEAFKTTAKARLYAGDELIRDLFTFAVTGRVDGNTEDLFLEVPDIRPESLHVRLHCFTDEMFLKVLADYESGKMKERLQKEFSLGKVERLKVTIENMEEVIETGKAIKHREFIMAEHDILDHVVSTTSDKKADTGGESAPKGQLFVEGHEPDFILPQTPTDPKTVTFYLLNLREPLAEIPSIHIGNSRRAVGLYPVPGEKNMWYCRVTFNCEPSKNKLKYQYYLYPATFTKGMFFFRQMIKKHGRSIVNPVQFDVFHLSSDRNVKSETLPKAVEFYLKWFFQFVKDSTISDILTFIQGFNNSDLGFRHLTTECVEMLVCWIVKQTSDSSTNDVQRLYLCMILSHLNENVREIKLQLNNIKDKVVVDRLLNCLRTCAHSNFLSESDCARLPEIAIILVESSSSPGWLTLAAHFYPYLGIRFLLNVASDQFPKILYDFEQYESLVAQLFSCFKVENRNDQVEHQELLRLVLENAPNLVVATNLFERLEMSKLFASEDEKAIFFVPYFEKAQNITETKKDSRMRPDEFHQTSKEIADKDPESLDSTKHDYSKSNDELKSEIKHLDVSKLTEILMTLSMSASLFRHNLLKAILNNDNFKESWSKIAHQDKVNICKSWVISEINNINIAIGVDRIKKAVAVYQCIDVLMQCSVNVSIQETLIPDVLTRVMESIFTKDDGISILQGFFQIGELLPSVQKCYTSYVKQILTPELIKSREFLSGCSIIESRGLKEILLCALEIIEVPTVNNEELIDEKDFKIILEWCDVWIILLKANGMLEDSKRYHDGKKICQQLAECIFRGSICPKFTEELYREKRKISLLCSNARPKQESRLPFEGLISKLKSEAEKFSRKIHMIESVIIFWKKLSHKDLFDSEIKNFKNIIEIFNDLRANLRTRKVNELQGDTIWGTLFPLFKPAETLQPLANSMTFMAVAEKCLESRKSDGDKDGSTRMNDFYSLIEFITSIAIKEFEYRWHSIFKDPESFNMEEMKSMLGNFKNQNQLDKEFEILKNFFPEPISGSVESYTKNCLMYQEAEKYLEGSSPIKFRNSKLTDMFEKLKSCLPKPDTLTLEKLDKFTKTLQKLTLALSEEVLKWVCKNSISRELVCFLEQIVDEDMSLLVGAVDEHFDRFVSESSVSDLIYVHGLLKPFIKRKKQECNAVDFLKMLKQSCDNHKDVEKTIQKCSINVHSLRGWYKSIANRGEMTKEIISNCLSRGEYRLSQKDGKCETEMSYEPQEDGGSKKYYSLPELQDLQSRAHLIATSHRNKSISSDSNKYDMDSTKCSENIDFDNFIEQVDLLTEISTLLSTLRLSGYVKYRNIEINIKTTEELRKQRNTLLKDKEKWENDLAYARKQYCFLNFYRSDQICIIYDYLMNESKVNWDEVASLIYFIDPTINEQQVKQQQSQKSDSNDNPELLLRTVGAALDEIFSESKPVDRVIPEDCQSQSHPTMEATVTPGEIFVASLELGSPLTANVILKLYENTSNTFPEPYQIVFCSSQTTWEEIHLLLQRCFTHSKYCHRKLFCIANVELLLNEIQFKLVNTLGEKQNCHERSKDKETDYHLALICRGGDHHHIVEQFAQYTHHIAGLSDLSLGRCLQSGWPNVEMITSALPGMGKTEHIKRDVREKSIGVATFPISGPFEASKLIRRLKDFKLENYHCLHLDVGEVSDPLSLDTFMFQLIVTGMVSAGNQFYHLTTTHIYIEIANTQRDWLRESFVILQFFIRTHLEWQNYRNLIVSSEITSNIQVVCQYLHIFDQSRIESEDVHFSGSKKSKPLPSERCQELLAKYYYSNADISFTTLDAFLGFLADQLSKLSKSAFFKVVHIKSMIGKKIQGVRRKLFKRLLKVSKEFASRALAPCRPSDGFNSQIALDESKASTVKSATYMVERVAKMIRWENSNHLLIVFHGCNSQAITAMYRDIRFVPESVKELLKSQGVRGNTELEDFNEFDQAQLQNKLQKIICTKSDEKEKNIPEGTSAYALTPDNILKMVLIILRVRANVPVIIMGETGCGKTSLIRYLANTCGVQFCTFNLHAGISEEDIVAYIQEKNESNEQMWIFLDEINTCDHLGIISEMICHHSLLGQPLSNSLVFLAACNPYVLRSEEQVKTAGLKDKQNSSEECSKLVYRVHPLPEAMVDYVWDYGSLAPEDERNYIKRMVKDLPKEYEGMLVDLLAASQKLIREAEKNRYCVSLRDVHRCIHLISWFEKTFKLRQELKGNEDEYLSYLEQYHSISQQCKYDPTIRSIVLALAHCYLCRLRTARLRKHYRECMMDIFNHDKAIMTYNADLDTFAAILRVEEEYYLDRMELPPGTARNAALRENVFVILVCILNRIPVFVFGKPGCSKSLSVQLIRSNLRGEASRDPWFRTLPQLYVVSYQGSQSSTSEGIIKVFEKAGKYKSHNEDENVLPVVLLDEVGLAEKSRHNPLKVLHSLLEPGEGKFPDVAVVGISNWSLDAAKMNRAIILSRIEPTIKDLFETGRSLYRAGGGDWELFKEKDLQCLAEAYFEYQAAQSYANFHGLRDYYSLIKNLAASRNHKGNNNISLLLQRNFGGLPGEETNIQKIFLAKLKLFDGQEITPVIDLIQANINDPLARHLMLIGNGDSTIDILKESLVELKEETITIFGSRFEEDSSDAYNYRILSRIILWMERNCTLILKDLENIYGSLYDMLNQNYAVVGNTKNCRVALGAYSNPMCQVNEGFRCIVLVDQVDCSDPPFLNRFEKQLLRFSDVLTIDQQNIITKLRHWVLGMSRVKGLESHFKKIDMFIGFYEDTLPSLVLSLGRDTDSSTLEKCKDELMWIASPDGVLRTRKCTYLNEDSQQVEKMRHKYFNGPIHQGFSVFVEHVTSQLESSFFAGDEIGSKTVVMTFANIHTDIRQCLEASLKLKCQAERLGAYKSEKQLTEMINKYWNAPEKELLVLQCKPDLDGKHLLLARFVIEEERNAYKRGLTGKKARGNKHVCIVVHVRRGEEADVSWQFNFVSRWRLVFLDVLEPPPTPLNEILGKSVKELLSSSIWPLKKIAQSQLLWCFTCLKYTGIQRPLRTVFHIAKNLLKSEAVSKAIKQLILESIDLKASKHQGTYSDWQVEVACDRQALVNSSTLYYAMKQFVSRLVRNQLCKIVYFLEKENAWPPHLTQEPNDIMKTKLEDLWCQLLVETKIFKMSDIPGLLGAESCVVESTSQDLCLPFSQLVSRKVDDVKELFLEDYAKLLGNDDDDKEAKQKVREQQVKRFTVMITNLVPELSAYTLDCYDLYMKDILDMTTANFSQTLSRSIRVSIAQAVFVSEERPDLPPDDMAEFCTLLHTFVWVNRKQISDLMQMICVCQPFIGLEVVAGLIEGIPCSSEEVKLSRTLPSDQEEAFTETERLRDIVVTAYCEQMFPSPNNVEKNGGPNAWTRNANLLLSSATKISEYPPALHYLRLCVDFSRIILPLNSSLLNTLNEIGMALKPEYLDNDKSFEMVTTYLIAPLKEGIRDNDDKKEALLKFLALFYGRCIDTNVDAFCVRSIIDQVLSLKESKFAMMMSPVVLRLLEVEETQTPGIFMDIISNPSALEDCPCLLNIDEAFKNLCSIDHDSYPAVMICDLIGLLLKFDRFKSGDRSNNGTFKFDDVSSPNCEVLMLAKSAINLISQNTEDERGLRILSAVAFLRRFITKLAEFIAKNPGVMMKDGPYTHVLNEINSLLRKPKIPLREFFVKILHKHLSLFDLEKLSTQNKVLPTVKNLWPHDALYQDKAVFTSVLMFSEYKEAKVAYLKLLSNDDSSMQGFLKTANGSPNHAFALLGVLINMIYLKRAVRRITDKEKQLVEWFDNKFKNFSKNDSFPRMFEELLLRIIGRGDFHCSQLQLSTESSVNEVEMALLILHVACVVATSSLNEKMPIYWYFTKPFKFTQPCVLAHCGKMRSVFQHLPSVEESARATCCSCGLRLAFKSNINETVCPHCQEALNNDETQNITSPETFSTQSLLSCCGNSSLDSDLCTKEMRPAVFRALHLIVYSSYYAGIALGISTGEDVSRVLNIVHGYDPKIDTKSPADFCFEIIESDLLHLMKIFNSEKDVVIKTMHLVLERSSALIRSKNLLGSNDCSTPEMCREWEDEFAKHTKAVLWKSRKLSMKIKGMIKLQQTKDSQAKVTLEDWILELDDYPEHREDKNQQLKRLFRMTKQPCFEDFRSAFLHSPEKVQSKHSFLTLFFAKFEQISIVGHLYHLLKWSRLVSSALSHRVSRKDAESKSINDFITGHLLQLNRTPQEKSSLKASFEKFQKAWNEVCLIVDQTNNKEKMPSLMETDYVAYCLTEGEYSIHLRNAIEILVSHQNSILDAMISLSSRHHPALSFLEQENYSSVAIASIQNVQEKEIINFHWSDELLKYTPRNLEYGKGHEIAYDFERIEIWLAETIAFGKCYLTGTLNEFIFAKELFHSYGPLLTEFRHLIKPCITLPKDVRKDLDELKEQRIKDAQDLLQHIEVLIFLLKRNLKNINVDMTLKVFTENCPTEIPFPIELLPQSGSSIKIQHVAALYEALEDVLADGAIEGLDGKFRKQMTDGMEKTVTAMTNRTTGGVQLKASDFLRVLRRFVFRYLSSEKYWPEESTPLQNHLKKPSLWFPLKPPNMDDIPKEITLEYIYSIVKYLEEEKKKANTSGKVTNFGGRRQLRKVSHIA